MNIANNTKINPKQIKNHINLAKEVRKEVLKMIYRTKSPHIGSCFSIVEILVALYFGVLNVSPNHTNMKKRDRFILSKGHACPALYATLSKKGFIAKEVLNKFAVEGGILEHHPTRNIQLGIEVSTGSLGHGLSIGVGMAIAAKYSNYMNKVFVLLSDGEMNEGSVWEAVMFASHRKLDNLVAVIDYNKMQALGKTEDILNLEPLGKKLNDFGWEVQEIDGHNSRELMQAFKNIPIRSKKPTAIIAHTILGKGVSFMQDKLRWHYDFPDKKEYKQALEELSI